MNLRDLLFLKGFELFNTYAPNGRILLGLDSLKKLLGQFNNVILLLNNAAENGDIEKLEFIILMFQYSEFLFGPTNKNQEKMIKKLCIKISSENSVEFGNIFLELMRDFFIDKYTFILRFVYINKSAILQIQCVMEFAMFYFGLGFINSQPISEVLFQDDIEKKLFLQEYLFKIKNPDEEIPKHIYDYVCIEMFLTLPYIESMYESKSFKGIPLHYLYNLLKRTCSFTLKSDLEFLIFQWNRIFIGYPFDHLLLLKLIVKVSNENKNNNILVCVSEMLDMSEVFDSLNPKIIEEINSMLSDMSFDDLRNLFATSGDVKRQRYN